MIKKYIWLIVSLMMVLFLLATSCAPATSANPTVSTTSTAPATKTTTTETKTTAPTSTQPTGPEMVKVSLKKMDGTTVERQFEKPKYGGTFVVAQESAVVGWDDATTPPYNSGNIDFTHEELVEGDWAKGIGGTNETGWNIAMWFDINYQKGMLAESWEVTEPNTITYKIRQGVRFGLNPALEASRIVGGRELTADDIVYNIRRVLFDIKTSALFANAGVSRPTDVYATDKYTVVVKAPDGQVWPCFEYVSEWMSIFPQELVKKYGDMNDWTRSVGTGPFYVTDYVPMSAVTYAKNTKYWGTDPIFTGNQVPYVDGVKLLIIPDTSTRMSALRTGKVDRLTGVTWEDAKSLNKTNPELLQSRVLGGPTLFGARVDKPDLPFKDIRVRRALMMALDKQKMAETYWGGEAVVYGYPVPPIKEWERGFTPLDQVGLAPDGFDTKKIYDFDPAGARNLLAEAGYPNGFKTEVDLTGSSTVDLATIIKSYWAEIGVDLTINVREAGVFQTIVNKKTHKEILARGWSNVGVAHTMDPNRTGNSYNFAMVSDPKIEEYYNKMAALRPRSDAWWATVKEQSKYVLNMVYYTTPPQSYTMTFWQPWLKRYNGEMRIGVFNHWTWSRYIWIDQGIKESMGK